jgi:S-adenosylmethionine hydrolase
VDETQKLYIEGPDNGDLMCVSRHDGNISFEEV